jgi:phage replication initiation protein
MTRPNSSALVLDGSEVKLRLVAERERTGCPVHVDWVRFTTVLRKAPAPDVEILFPRGRTHDGGAYDKWQEVARVLRTLPDCEHDAAAQAHALAERVASALGQEFAVASDVRKGHDFYRFRWAITRNEVECGWVGFLASGDSPRQQAQARTLHVNVWGSACTFGDAGWNDRLADLIDECDGDLTRCDLAADFFDGIAGGMDRVLADYKAGGMDSGGKRLKCNMVGDWANGRERSFYVGSKEAGKQTNVYEKGDQLFGVEAASAWMRIEGRYGNKLRVLPSDMLRRPADFFAGMSEWHALMLAELSATVTAEKVRCHSKLSVQTVLAECVRNARWAVRTAGPTFTALLRYVDFDGLRGLMVGGKLPKRLQRFSDAELAAGFVDAFRSVSPVEGAAPALA